MLFAACNGRVKILRLCCSYFQLVWSCLTLFGCLGWALEESKLAVFVALCVHFNMCVHVPLIYTCQCPINFLLICTFSINIWENLGMPYRVMAHYYKLYRGVVIGLRGGLVQG